MQTNTESLAVTLRQRRQFNDKMEQERTMHGIDRANIKVTSGTMQRKVPKETDKTGSAFRIRPQTPKINLLKLPQQQY